jgi:phage baseplate assembly protein V
MITGIVEAVDAAKAKVRVQFPDRDNLVSDWLPVGQRKTLGDFDYWLPEVNTQVVCLMDENLEAGVVLCAIYSDADVPPAASADVFLKRFKDGTMLQYDRAAHKLTVDVKGDIEATATGTIKTTAAGGQTIDGGSNDVTGAVTRSCICAFYGGPHIDASANVEISKG